ncbi:MAG TPA: LUD domain-containing protein [Candidatus Angelobacter sp.]|nr:LUD domain-containing protein [Candidatus Angelobacter sp.]
MADGFAARYRAAADNPQLGGNLLAFQRGWQSGRDARFAPGAAPEGFETLRRRLVAAKDDAIARQPELLAQFTERARKAGMSVHAAATEDDAVEIVAAICREHGAQTVIKTKSMASEEIHLNHRLEERGIAAVETDVGEWIVQLRGETPSHMVMPAIHLNRRQVAATLRTATGGPVPDDDVAGQVGVVRGALRPRFLDARVGITGANALVAESGAVLLVTNEGNEGLLTALVDVQIVLAGVEKLLPTLDDAVSQVRLLARSATGQVITTYTTLIAAPGDGQQIHVVLLDNGRGAMRDDPEFRDALRCIRCAACASVCPPYQVVGGQVFGHIYSGAIGLVNTPFHHGLDAAAGPQSLCVSCNACQTVCPVDIPLPRQILAVRRRVVEQRGLGALRRAAFAVWRRPRLFGALATAGAIATAPLRHDGRLRVPRPRRHAWRAIPAMAPRPAHRLLPATTAGAGEGPLASSGARGLRVALFIQCITDRFRPELAQSAVRLLAACGADVVVPRSQHCCGLPLFDSGDWAGARAMAQQTIAALESSGADWVVSPANSCVAMLLHDYPGLFADDPAWCARAQRLAERTLDMATFLDTVARLPDGALAASGDTQAYTYHPFCQTRTVLGADGAARRLLEGVCAIQLRELPESSVCCGFGGSTSFTAPELGRGMVLRKLENIDATGATVVVSDNPGCLLHLRGAAFAAGRPSLRFEHLVEVLARRVDAASAERSTTR